MRILLPAVAAIVLTACSTAPKTSQAPAVEVTPGTTAPATSSAQPVAPTAAVPEYLDPNSQIARNRSVHFGFDDSSIRQDDHATVELQGRYLAAHPNVAVRVEGNTDERGSAEYNLALGQRRAESVVRALKVFGARDSQMEATSWGEEKPVAQGHDEQAWAQNRRADVVYPTK